jgi:hypothetical protein
MLQGVNEYNMVLVLLLFVCHKAFRRQGFCASQGFVYNRGRPHLFVRSRRFERAVSPGMDRVNPNDPSNLLKLMKKLRIDDPLSGLTFDWTETGT